ncbi:MAG: ribosomal RNA small subunit methyltransferase I [Patescibacteria group bacterium]
MNNGKIYLVATPIGNLGDITLRALEILKSVDFILCEDTRVTKNLLVHYNISKPLLSYHHHSPESKVKEIIGLLADGKNLALVTDAGTPGISDPGNLLIRDLVRYSPLPRGNARGFAEAAATPPSLPLERGGGIIPIPGPSAVTSALSISGFPTDKFLFLGFPPHKNKRQKFFKEVASAEHTVVFYESPHRIKKCLSELSAVLEPERGLVVCRELTKKFESIYRGTIAEILKMNIPEKGEFVIVINQNYEKK